jgi:hypothetical protein|tara:strand:+ start:735 stop:2018 length:1284 start_codon:yes stop_codon:yes gene_type:complete
MDHKIELFDFQQEVLIDPARFKVMASGRRVGKSYLAAVAAYQHCLEEGNRRAIIIGPTVSMIRESIWTTLKGLVHPDHINGYPREIDLEIRFINGSKITLKGFDRPDALRGISPSPTFIVLDEFAYIKQHAFTEVILPMTSDPQRKAKVFVISTPKGITNDFYKLWIRGQEDKTGLWKSWQFTAESVRPDMKEELDLARSTMDEKSFNQEYCATFNNTGDSVFYNFNRNVNVTENLLAIEPGEPIHISIDFNVKIMASTVWCHRGNQLHAMDEFYGNADTYQLIRSIKGKYKNRDITCYPDASGRAMKTSAATGTTDFSILRNAGFKVLARSKQPPIIDSVNSVNALLKDATGKSRLYFNKNTTPRTIASIETTTWKEGFTTGMDNAIIDKSKGVEHFSDGIRYICEFLYPIGKHKPQVIRDRSWSF